MLLHSGHNPILRTNLERQRYDPAMKSFVRFPATKGEQAESEAAGKPVRSQFVLRGGYLVQGKVQESVSGFDRDLERLR